jgi:hypothetical protein
MADEISRKQLHFLTKILQRQGENGANDYSKTGNNTPFSIKTSENAKFQRPTGLRCTPKTPLTIRFQA